MVDRVLGIGTRCARRDRVAERIAIEASDGRPVWIVDDEPAAASLAVELCTGAGGEPTVFHRPLPFLAALRTSPAPAAVILDWRLEHELSAALFLATRHRYERLPVVFWTGSARASLPGMIRGDAYATVVDKAAGTTAFEAALAWAFRGGSLD
jgi:CheY-like chemotaxis protein